MSHEEIRVAREKASAELLDDFFKIAKEWELSSEEQKKLIGDKSIDRKSVPLLDDTSIARLVMIIGIKNDLHILYPEPRCNIYLRSANKYFEGKSPLSIMLNEQIDGIARVKTYLKGAILGGYS